MALLRRTDVGFREIGSKTTVPNDPAAKLMYYLDCVSTVLALNSPDIHRLSRYNEYYRLDREDKDLLISLCLLLKPDILINKCFFQSDALCDDRNNKFYEISAVQNNLMVAGAIMINGRRTQVQKIMAFKMVWLRTFWIEAMQLLVRRQEQERQALMRSQTTQSCVIL